jgi:hypothetical protein
MAGLLQWRLDRPLTAVTATLLILSAGLLLWAPLTVYHHLSGAALLFGVILWQRYQERTQNVATT